ncbi:MAG: aspartate kinase [Alphaproteobacteria bacterium]
MSKLSVLKFGGSSFAPTSRYGEIASELARRVAKGERLVVVVSAPPGLTENWRTQLLSINAHPSDEILGGLLPRADTVGAYFLSAALESKGITSRVLTGNEVGIQTDSNYCRAQILSMDMRHLRGVLEYCPIVIVPGGQAENAEHQLTWLGKNSSDFSAIALAAALNLPSVDIHSDAEGIFSCDPAFIPGAQILPKISYGDAITMSLCGAKVLHHGGVLYAREHGVEIRCMHNQSPFQLGTTVGVGPVIRAVIPDFQSVTLSFSLEQVRQNVLDKLRGAAVPVIDLPPEQGKQDHFVLAITCGYFDVEHFLASNQLQADIGSQKLLTVLDDGRVEHSLWSSDAELTQAAICIHKRLYQETVHFQDHERQRA